MPPNAPERDDERGRICRLRAAAKRARRVPLPDAPVEDVREIRAQRGAG